MTDKVVKNNIEAFAERYLNLELQKKTINEDIKQLKDEYNQEGVPTQVVQRVINDIKRMKNRTDSENHEHEVIMEWLLGSGPVSDSISALI